ncbi:MAG TPA: phosphatidate cytidylyltransferase [Gammaproteobacteria bacterium]|nr:phosphatidate cytidylyltransferase [Gammaproteobacteria bacterium]
MLKQRVITALIVGAVALALIFFAPRGLFDLAMLGLMLLGAWEWSALAGRPDRNSRLALAVAFGLLALAAGWLQGREPRALLIYCVAALAWWVVSLAWIASWRAEFSRPVKILCGLVTLLPSLTAVVAIRGWSPWYLLVLLLVTSGADIGAYFAGRTFGRHKLAPQVSPGKTWEGVAGGVGMVILVAAICDYWLKLPVLPFIALCVCVALLSVVGDLSESLFKRQAGLKDSGNFFPGHGGVLDRVDSITAAASLYWLGMSWLLGGHS